MLHRDSIKKGDLAHSHGGFEAEFFTSIHDDQSFSSKPSRSSSWRQKKLNCVLFLSNFGTLSLSFSLAYIHF
jgi:hypothetical protein